MKQLFLYSILLCNYYNINSQTTVGLIQRNTGSLDDGYVLFSPTGGTSTYLIDKCGKQVKSWASAYKPGQSCYILPDGTLLRPANANNTTFDAGGKGGIIQKIDWDGNVIWSYTISSAVECQHHDIKALPNGNVVAIVWESKTNTQAIAQGRNPALTTTTVWSEKIIEIQPVGLTGGTIVWEWHLWDHLVQDFDNTKPNYGSVASNPQLLNLNYSASSNTTIGQDWIHLNSIDYNPTLNQILLSSHSFDEIWIIDHSTTTAEAAGHTGGNSGKGGDVLYRWGNPQAYNNGTVANQKLFGQHNAYWIENGLPYQDQIMIFNNGNGRTGGNYSTIEIISPPVSGFTYSTTLPFLPNNTSWIYNAGNTNTLYAQNISGSQQLSNGNVLFCNGPSGVFKEVSSTGTTLWEYVNPVNTTGTINQGLVPSQNIVFRCTFYPKNYSGFVGKILTGGSTIENVNTVSGACNFNLLDIGEVTSNETADLYPNPTKDFIKLIFNNNAFKNVKLLSLFGEIMYSADVCTKDVSIPVASYSKGFYFVEISEGNSRRIFKIIVTN